MNPPAEKFLLQLLLNAPSNTPISIPEHLGYFNKIYKMADKQVYYTLFKWSKQRIVIWGTSPNFPWIDDRSIAEEKMSQLNKTIHNMEVYK